MAVILSFLKTLNIFLWFFYSLYINFQFLHSDGNFLRESHLPTPVSLITASPMNAFAYLVSLLSQH